MATFRLRDRDAIVTKEGLIFRVFGYSHPSDAYICDAEYAPATIFKSANPKAFRNKGKNVFYKFYEDEGWKFIRKCFPQYMVLYEMIRKKVVGVNQFDIVKTRKPEVELRKRVRTEPKDELLAAMQNVLGIITQRSGLSVRNFGVFGSLLHGFYHPEFSDIDLIIYGKRNVVELYETLLELYRANSSPLQNEFETAQSIRGKSWRFQNFTLEEYVGHQRRKLIYALFDDEKSGRIVKTEFEPVKDWKEITNEYNSKEMVLPRGWTRMQARVTEDSDAPFIPSVYGIEPLQVLDGRREAIEAKRIVSYMEEFRMQARRDETVYVEGNLEEVETPKDSLYQITLTYCPRYYEQVLKTTIKDRTF